MRFSIFLCAVLACSYVMAQDVELPQPPAGYENIAMRAEVRPIPRDAQSRIQYLTDGKAGVGRVFYYPRSRNGGRVRMRFRMPLKVCGIRFHQPLKDYTATAFRVLADVKGEGDYTFELTKSSAGEVPGWSGADWTPKEIWGIDLIATEGKSASSRAYPALSEVVVFGEKLPPHKVWPEAPIGYANIALDADISSQPTAKAEDFWPLIDDRIHPARGFAFPVKSQGAGKFIFRFRQPRMVSGLYFHQNNQTYFAQSYRILGDLDGKGEYATELAAGECEPPSAWAGTAWEPREVWGLQLEAVKGIAKGARAYPALNEVVIFGKELSAIETQPQPPAGYENIACAAEVTARPEGNPKQIAWLTDGKPNPSRGYVFPVKTKGAGEYTLRFAGPHVTVGLYAHQPQDHYWMKNYHVLADVKGAGKYDVLLGAGACGRPPSWAGAEWEPREVYGLRLKPLEGRGAGNGRAWPILSEIMVFGKPEPGDQEAMRKAGRTIHSIWSARKLDSTIDLSGTARPVAVVTPAGDEWRGVGEELAAKLKTAHGIEAQWTPNAAETLPDKHNVIVIGDVNTNELFARLYWNHYTFANSLWPGDGEFALRTIYDPYPWYGQGDVIAIGCSDIAGARRGCAELLARIDSKGKALGYTLVVSNAPKPAKQEDQPTLWTWLTRSEAYFKSGHAEDAREALKALDAMAEFYATGDPLAKRHFPITWPEEMNSDRAMAYWDALEEYPGLTDEQRLRHSRMWITIMRGLITRTSDWAQLLGPQSVAYNHTTFPLKGIYFCARYFDHYYGLTEAKDYLARARNCFMSQAKSWKSSEDSDAYQEYGVNHAIDYLLAEWNLAPLRTGLYRDFAEYSLAINDSRGFNTGFGDSGLGGGPSRPMRVLPRAFWFTRDGRYLWALQHYERLYGRTWKNIYHRDVKPVPDTEHTGLRVFPMTAGVYEYTQRHSWMGEGVVRPNISLEETFDKAVFRESWAGDSQYLMLDGYARGHHLHYDGNGITTFVDRGRPWLIDHDYLIRNTTEHNMLTVIRDGRADKAVPSCSALVASGDGERFAMTCSETRDYMGLDWRRSIFWRKGDYFVVMERCTARAAGEYALDFTWKTIDMGLERVAESGAFLVDRPSALPIRRDVYTIEDENASKGKAIVLGRNSSVWSFVADLPAGEYVMTLFAYGLDTGSDSVHALSEWTGQVDHHLKKLAYGPSSQLPDHSAGPPLMKVGRGGRHVISIIMREAAPVRIDRVVFADKHGREAAALEAEDAPAPTTADAARLDGMKFWLKWADPVATRVTRYTTRGISAPLAKLWQRRAVKLAAGESAEVANVLYTEASGERMQYNLKRVGAGMVLLNGDEQALFAVKGFAFDGLRSDAETLCITEDRVSFAGGTFVQLGEARIERKGSGGLEQVLDQAVRAEAKALLQRAVATAKGLQVEDKSSDAAASKPAWEFHAGKDMRIARLRSVDLDGDGQEEILIAAGPSVVALTSGGKRLWSLRLNGICHDVNAGELMASPGLEIIVACGDYHLYLLDGKGNILRKKSILTVGRNERFKRVLSTPLTAAILNTDGTPRVFAANTNYDLIAYNAELEQTNISRLLVQHGGIDIFAGDVNGDGKQEVFCTNHYGSLSCFDHTGKYVWQYYTSIGDMQAALGDLDGDGQVEAVYGSSTGHLFCRTFLPAVPFQQATVSQWAFSNFGYPVNRVRMGDLDGDGKDEALIASGTGYLYALDARGKVKWQVRTGVDTADVLVLKGKQAKVACIDRSGAALLLDGEGKVISAQHVAGSPGLLVECDGQLVIAATERITALRAQ